MAPVYTRRSLLAAGTATMVGSIAGCQSPGTGGDANTTPSSTAQTTAGTGTDTTGGSTTQAPDAALPDRLSVETVATGLTAPLAMAVPETNAVGAYVVDQVGLVRVLDGSGLRAEPFLDVRDRMVPLRGYEERGLLGIALHPDFDENGRVFLRYSGPGAPTGYSHTFVLSEFQASPDRTRADPASERRLLEIPEPQSNHNAGPIAFGPDGYLYVAVGDGGAGDDRGRGHVSDWYDENDGGNGQDVTENLLGSVLRIDVDDRAGGREYAIPQDNPLVGREGLDEHYAWGFRNPWGMSFTGEELFVADVGQNRFEEVDLVEAGGNYGWNVREGTHCFSTRSPSTPPETCPAATPDGDPLRDPIIEYSHGGPVGGAAVVGGYLYMGEAIPGLQDTYVFADWRANGRLYVATRADEGLWPLTPIPVSGTPSFGDMVLGFGRDLDGELYVLTTGRSTVSGSTGAVHRLRAPE